jgi:hypothetical protein
MARVTITIEDREGGVQTEIDGGDVRDQLTLAQIAGIGTYVGLLDKMEKFLDADDDSILGQVRDTVLHA